MTRSPPALRSGPAPAGHTLWEVLLVLALLGTLAALVAPTLRATRPPPGDAAGAARDLATVAQRARLTALERGVTVEVRLDPATGRGLVFALAGDSLVPIEMLALPHDVSVDVSARAPRVRYVFAPTGEGWGDSLIVRGQGHARRLSVDPWLGGVHVDGR